MAHGSVARAGRWVRKDREPKTLTGTEVTSPEMGLKKTPFIVSQILVK